MSQATILRQQSRARFAATFDEDTFPRDNASRIYRLVRETVTTRGLPVEGADDA